MRINANVMAVNTHRQLYGSQTAGAKAMEKLSSGFRINRAADDAAGLAISEKMRSQIRGMKQASRNAQDGISVVQTAEGALDEVHSMLQRMKELAVQSASDSNQSLVDREALQLEIDQLTEEIDSITAKTQFNKMTLLDGTFKGKKFHVGANQDETIDISIESMTAKGLSLKIGGSEEIVSMGGNSRTVNVRGGQAITRAASAIAADTTLVLASYKSDALVTGEDKKAKFQVVVNGKATTFEVDAVKGAFTNTAVMDAAVKALNSLTEDGMFAASTATATINLTKELSAESAYTGANIKIEWTNEADFGIGETKALHKVGKDVGLGDKVAAVAEISQEAQWQHYELSVDGSAPVEFTLTKEEIVKAGNTPAAMKALVEGKLGSFKDKVEVSFAELANGNILSFKSKTEGMNSTVSVRVAGEAARKTVNYKGVNVLTREAANASLSNVQSAIENLASRRAKLGAVQNRLEHTIKNLDNSHENLVAAESRVRHVDMALEIIESTRNNILQQAATSMLAQANQAPQTVLSLLR